MSVSDALKGRWTSNAARLDKSPLGLATRKHFHQVLHAHDTLEQRRAEISANRSLSAIGQADELKKVAAAEARTLAAAQRMLAASRAKVTDQRRALAPTISDKTDAAAAAMRKEIRESLKDMPRGDVADLCNDPATDSIVLEALFEGPTFLTKIDSVTRDQLLEIVVQRRAGPAVEALRADADALDLLEAANRVAAETLRGAAGVAASSFDKWLGEAAPIDPKEVESEAAKFNSEMTAAAAKALPLAERLSLVDSLLAHNTAEIKGLPRS